MILYEFQKVTIRINSYGAYRISYQYRMMIRIPYTNLIQIFGDHPLYVGHYCSLGYSNGMMKIKITEVIDEVP